MGTSVPFNLSHTSCKGKKKKSNSIIFLTIKSLNLREKVMLDKDLAALYGVENKITKNRLSGEI